MSFRDPFDFDTSHKKFCSPIVAHKSPTLTTHLKKKKKLHSIIPVNTHDSLVYCKATWCQLQRIPTRIQSTILTMKRMALSHC